MANSMEKKVFVLINWFFRENIDSFSPWKNFITFLILATLRLFFDPVVPTIGFEFSWKFPLDVPLLAAWRLPSPLLLFGVFLQMLLILLESDKNWTILTITDYWISKEVISQFFLSYFKYHVMMLPCGLLDQKYFSNLGCRILLNSCTKYFSRTRLLSLILKGNFVESFFIITFGKYIRTTQYFQKLTCILNLS